MQHQTDLVAGDERLEVRSEAGLRCKAAGDHDSMDPVHLALEAVEIGAVTTRAALGSP
jgi:hypothetical protein